VGSAVMSGSAHGIAPVQGNNSPDKEFRSNRLLRALIYQAGLVVSANLPTSPQGSDHLILSQRGEGRRMVSEGSRGLPC
jgi:hypothetical protein